MKKINTKQMALAGLFLALTIVSQFFKNTSVYITGSVVNMFLLLTVFYCGIGNALIISIISPLTAFLITGSPLMAAVPLIMPGIMLGNAVYCMVFYMIIRLLGEKKEGKQIYNMTIRLLGAGFGALFKTAAMTIVIVHFIIPTFGAKLPEKMIAVANVQFSVTQLITALIGGVCATLLMVRVPKKILENME